MTKKLSGNIFLKIINEHAAATSRPGPALQAGAGGRGGRGSGMVFVDVELRRRSPKRAARRRPGAERRRYGKITLCMMR